jgi:hypothetical protein
MTQTTLNNICTHIELASIPDLNSVVTPRYQNAMNHARLSKDAGYQTTWISLMMPERLLNSWFPP